MFQTGRYLQSCMEAKISQSVPTKHQLYIDLGAEWNDINKWLTECHRDYHMWVQSALALRWPRNKETEKAVLSSSLLHTHCSASVCVQGFRVSVIWRNVYVRIEDSEFWKLYVIRANLCERCQQHLCVAERHMISGHVCVSTKQETTFQT